MEKEEKFFQGMGLGSALIAAGIALPFLFPNKITLVIATILIGSGISGFGIELDQIHSTKNNTNTFLGITFLLIGSASLLLFTNLLTKILFLVFLIIGIFGLVQGVLDTVNKKKKHTNTEKNNEQIIIQKKKLNLGYLFSSVGFIADITSIILFLRS